MSENTATKSRGVGCSGRRPRRWACRLFSPEWHQELLALALIIMTLATSWLLAGH